MVERWGVLVAARAVRTLVVGLVLAALAAGYGAGVFDSLSDGGFDDPDSESARQLAAERVAFGNLGVDVVALYSSDDLSADQEEFRAEVAEVLERIPAEHVTAVVPWFETGDRGMVSEDGHTAQVLISLAGETQDEMGDSYRAIAPLLESSALRTDLAGTWATYADLNHQVSADLKRAELLALPIVLVLSLLIFGSIVAALLPVVVGGIAVVGALAMVRVITEVTDVSVFAINIITLLGMGLAIDYALFVVSRFREELDAAPDASPASVRAAVVATMATAGRTVLFSGLTVAAAMSSLLVFPQAFLKSIGYGGITAVSVAMVAALTVLPALLALLGHRVDAGRVPLLNRPRRAATEHGGWARLAHAVMRRPIAVIVIVAAALLALGSPFAGVHWGSVDYRVLPADADSHVAAAKLNDEFGAELSTANVLVTGAGEDALVGYLDQLAAVPGVASAEPVAPAGGSGDGAPDTSLIRVVWEGNSQTEASQRLIGDLRSVPAPDGAQALVGGLSADTVDLLDSIGGHLVWMALVVVSVMLVLLFLAFGSLVMPVKAVLMNALSIVASFGIVTWIFSEGHLEGLLGFESSGFLDATQPILMLAILFGLSMDYEVFLLSRVREEWDRTGDNERAVATGVQKTGRIITSAAVLLGVVIGAFATSGVVFMKMIGVGMLIALLIDATVIRALLVPATMKLLGGWNWWAPGPMRRWWERHGFREDGSAAQGSDPQPAADLAADLAAGSAEARERSLSGRSD